jgi:methionine synthase II (cobalamin-independent)
MEKLLKTEYRSFDVTKGITIDEFNDKYNKIISQLEDKYGHISNIKIYAESGTYNDDEDYFGLININYSRYETDDEFEKRANWIECRNKEQTENELKKLKEYIKKYPDIANEYMNELIER